MTCTRRQSDFGAFACVNIVAGNTTYIHMIMATMERGYGLSFGVM